MCLAVPGRIVSLDQTVDDPTLGQVGTVDFQGSRVEVSLVFTPAAGVGDWVLVHAGFALQVLSEADALQTWEYLKEAGVGPPPAAER